MNNIITMIPSPKRNRNQQDGEYSPTILPRINANSSPKNKQVNNPFKKAIMGDIFGSSVEVERLMSGLMYRSRIDELNNVNALKEKEAQENSLKAIQGMKRLSTTAVETLNPLTEDDFNDLVNMNPRQQLAVTIRNWSKIPENDSYIIKEGAVHALIALTTIDDPLIKECCACSFYHLSLRNENREELLSLGASGGIITLSMQARSEKISKLCAMTLCNLSMQPRGEATMAKDGALIALMILLGTKGHKLLPICVQALYNLTCVNDHYKETERILKALINIPPTNFDHLIFLVKALVNCSRFSWTRLRIIEDGGIAALSSMVQTLSLRVNCDEFVRYMLICLRFLSESITCRHEMLSRGVIDLLFQLLPYSIIDISNIKSRKWSTVGSSRKNSLIEGIKKSNELNINQKVSIKNNLLNESNNLSMILDSNQNIKDEIQLLLIKTLHNLMLGGTSVNITNPLTFPIVNLSNGSYENAMNLVYTLITNSNNIITLQYCSACLHLFSNDNFRYNITFGNMAIGILSKLLRSVDSLTQFYAINTASNIFFANLCNEINKIENLVYTYILIGQSIKDELAIQALAISLAKLSQDNIYNSILEKKEILEPLIILLLNLLDHQSSSIGIKDSCSIAISRLCLNLNKYSENNQIDDENTIITKNRISKVIIDMLDPNNDVTILTNAIATARLLGRDGLIFHSNYTIDLFYNRISLIVMKYQLNESLCRMCCALLAVFSNTNSFEESSKNISNDTLFYQIESSGTNKENRSIDNKIESKVNSVNTLDNLLVVLYTIIKSEDNLTRELVATILCNMSFRPTYRQRMVDSGVIDKLSLLSGTTSETIQELCAKCICNLTCSIEIHSIMIKCNIIQIILMISLVRSVGIHTKQLCGKALLNLITNDNIEYLKSIGAIRVFTTLSQINDVITRNISAKGYLLFSLDSNRCEELIIKHTTLQSLFSMIKVKSVKTKVIVGITICNLLGTPISQRAAIMAGALSVLKLVVLLPYDDMKESISKVIISLSNVLELHSYLLKDYIIMNILIMILQHVNNQLSINSNDLTNVSSQQHNYTYYTLSCCINALTSICRFEPFRVQCIDKGCVEIIVNIVLNNYLFTTNNHSSTIETSIIEILRLLYYLSYCKDRIDVLVQKCYVLLSIQGIFNIYLSNNQSNTMNYQYINDCVILISLIIRNLSFDRNIRYYYIDHKVLPMLISILHNYPTIRHITYVCTIVTLYNLSHDRKLHNNLITHGYLDILHYIISPNNKQSTPSHSAIVLNSPRVYKFDNKAINKAETKLDHKLENQSLKTRYTVNQNNDNKVILSTDDVIYISKSIEYLTQSDSCRLQLVEANIIDVFYELFNGITNLSRFDISCAICNLTSSKECRELLVKQGTTDLLIKLSDCKNVETQNKCTLAIGYLSDLTKVSGGVVQSALMLTIKNEDHGISESLREAIVASAVHLDSSKSSADNSVSSPTSTTSVQHKSLKNLLREGLNRRRASKAVYMKRMASESNEDIINDTNSLHGETSDYDSIIVNSHVNPKYIEIEHQSLVGNYSSYSYRIHNQVLQSEIGGIADEFDIEFTMPNVVSDKSMALIDRSNELMKVNQMTESLAKDFTTHSEETIQLVDDILIANDDDISSAAAINSNSLKFNVITKDQNNHINKRRSSKSNVLDNKPILRRANSISSVVSDISMNSKATGSYDNNRASITNNNVSTKKNKSTLSYHKSSSTADFDKIKLHKNDNSVSFHTSLNNN